MAAYSFRIISGMVVFMAKAGRPRKGSPGLPDWFDIEKYRPVKNFSALEWFEQLVFRGRLLLAIDECRKAGDESLK